jgi:hypothetical protein
MSEQLAHPSTQHELLDIVDDEGEPTGEIRPRTKFTG